MKKFLLFILPACSCLAGFSQPRPSASDSILGQFQNPAAHARPRVWWHWINGNITKEGISKNLHWMARTIIGSFQTGHRPATGHQSGDLAGSPLLPSGLLRPVRIISKK